eukprot:UN00252
MEDFGGVRKRQGAITRQKIPIQLELEKANSMKRSQTYGKMDSAKTRPRPRIEKLATGDETPRKSNYSKSERTIEDSYAKPSKLGGLFQNDFEQMMTVNSNSSTFDDFNVSQNLQLHFPKTSNTPRKSPRKTNNNSNNNNNNDIPHPLSKISRHR